MTVHVPSTAKDNNNDDDAVPLFKLERGIAVTSAGLVCAKMAGVNVHVNKSAKEMLNAMKQGRPVRPVSASENSNSAFRKNAKLALRFFSGGGFMGEC